MTKMQELMRCEYFCEALQTFYLIQEWGEKYQNGKRTRIKIREILEEDSIWNGFSKRKQELDKIHQQVGQLIAHNFPYFAALCTIPVYVVFDKVDKNNEGLYRLATYSK